MRKKNSCVAIQMARRLFTPIPQHDIDDPFSVMGLPRNANRKRIQKRFKEISMLYHPDRLVEVDMTDEQTNEADTYFKRVVQAREILVDPRRRKLFLEHGFVDTGGKNPWGLRKDAEKSLGNLVLAYCNKLKDEKHKYVDMIALMGASIKDTRSQLLEQFKNLKVEIKRVEDIVPRFSIQHTFMTADAEKMILNLRKQHEQTKKDFAVAEEMEVLLKDYKYRVDKKEAESNVATEIKGPNLNIFLQEWTYGP